MEERDRSIRFLIIIYDAAQFCFEIITRCWWSDATCQPASLGSLALRFESINSHKLFPIFPLFLSFCLPLVFWIELSLSSVCCSPFLCRFVTSLSFVCVCLMLSIVQSLSLVSVSVSLSLYVSLSFHLSLCLSLYFSLTISMFLSDYLYISL